jgi:hypothetical protein
VFAGTHYGGAQIAAFTNVDYSVPFFGVATPRVLITASTAAEAPPTVVALAAGLAVSTEIRALGGVAITTGGTAAAGTTVYNNYLGAPIVTAPVAVGATAGAGITFAPTSDADRVLHTVVLVGQDNPKPSYDTVLSTLALLRKYPLDAIITATLPPAYDTLLNTLSLIRKYPLDAIV